MMLKNKQIAFIGGGHITEIIVGNLIRTQTVSPDQIIVSDPDKNRLKEAIYNATRRAEELGASE